MRHLTIPGWTDRHRAVGAAFAVASVASLAGLADARPVPVWVGVAVGITAILALASDPFAGLVVGLTAAAAVIAARRLVGPWGPEAFLLSFTQTIAVVTTGIVCGRAGTALRRAELEAVPALPSTPAFGALGLLEGEIAMARLEEEVDRAVEHRRPLTLVLLGLHALSPTVTDEDLRSAFRGVARVLEARLLETDVPFAIAEDQLGAVLPETPSSAACARIGLVLDAVIHAAHTSRSLGPVRSLAEVVRIDVGLAELGPAVATADQLLDAATAPLDRSRERQVPVADETLG